MSARALSAGALAVSATAGLCFASIAWLSTATADQASSVYPVAVAVVAAVALAVVVWLVEPAYTLSAAIFLTPLAGNWEQLGVPGALSPDRLLFAGAIVAVLMRAPPVADRPRLQISGAHWLLALAVVYTLASAFFAGTLTDNDSFLKIVDAFGILPFLVFLVAPLAFRTERQRHVLLGTLVALGAYLGLTVLFETLKLDALVFPKYILDPDYGIHYTRGRGPFVDAVANGLALYMCSVACAIAAASWRSPPMRAIALAIGLLCLVGAFLSLERSVWIGAVLGTGVAMLATPRPAPLPPPPRRHRRRRGRRGAGGDPGAVGIGFATGQRAGNDLGSQEPCAGGRQHGRGQAAAGLRMEPLRAGQLGLLRAVARLPADRDERRGAQHPAHLCGRPGARRDDALDRGRAVRCRRCAGHPGAAGPEALAGGVAGCRDRLPRRAERGTADGMAEPLALAAGGRRLQRPLPHAEHRRVHPTRPRSRSADRRRSSLRWHASHI